MTEKKNRNTAPAAGDAKQRLPADPEQKRAGETDDDAKIRRSNQAGDQDVSDANGEIPDPPPTKN